MSGESGSGANPTAQNHKTNGQASEKSHPENLQDALQLLSSLSWHDLLVLVVLKKLLEKS
ncbi:hypothetical protein [Polycladidibacter hongkongensis]|uniref:hypothetical protein n=1 Tax=Polycladidibacter hongkongensis TaxID=1647556 RepID=UPI00082D868A|nr:hypothetical protein [Pseudovibrio hongkongensis]